ncbi:bifunctional acetate--CoA ligase family protein/GNAT family N-acetyltransferase [Nitrospirillum sp. BR 11163]|uniref:bifunctional acetate--CoA ligase family protein/GNAT family N-acetyltransferase n=1 Tax=Nitrospirillum sp. BR 11163 TaxID=3104323 RepID=UPI002B000474|nr:bifunctional acetate--CoA ligase family protein/GNAT family N-acetyltransferase [Nitrospirillum sp. BR 11163]MEA1677536.1 bifunctional acetate--CoA ligase family protein/GNAT family N-acetyltransferase [Nitrospirillum sp. BR 11163]
MTIRNLHHLFKPSSIALIGASRRPHTVGAVVARNLFGGGFDGPIMPVNPQERSIEGVLTYPDVASLPVVPDLAVICTPPSTVPELIRQLGERGTKAAVVITAGFAELGEAGKALQQQVLDAAKPHLLRVVGPNCLGVMAPGNGLNASFVHVPPLRGDIALLAQSGAVVTSVVDWATPRGIGFSHLVSLGGMADIDFGDLLDFMAQDGHTRAILLYVEAIAHARKFMSAARAAARSKPVIVIKAGRSDEAARAATSHTGSLAGADAIYDAAFRRAGMLRVGELSELFDAVETLATGVQIKGDRLAILTNGGGMGVLATDSLIEQGGRLAQLSPEAIAKLDSLLPPTWSHGNPIDVLGDANGKRYADALSVLLEEKDCDAVLVMNCPTAVADSGEAARAVIDTLRGKRFPVLANWLGEGAAVEARRLFAANRIPSYQTPDEAIRAFMHLVRYRRNQDELMEVPSTVPDQFVYDGVAARVPIEQALAEGRAWLSEYEAKQVLRAYGIPVVETVTAASPEEAEGAARRLAVPGRNSRLALKILSPDITHKSDLGGVALNLAPDEVRLEAEAMLARIRAAAPGTRIEGFTVQQMAHMPGAVELIVGMADDPLFGPVLVFGQGGTEVEVVQDKALALPPLNMNLARDMMARTRVHKLLQGYRHRPPADLTAIALTLNKVSQLVIDFPEIQELDINPLYAGADGVMALDARIRVAPPPEPGAVRLAIRAYPKRLEQHVKIHDGREFLIRPIRPEDEPLIHDMIARTAIEDIRLRFFAPMRRLSRAMAARLTQIDYDREMALVAIAPDPAPPPAEGSDLRAGDEAIFGTVRITADPDNEKAEYAVLVRSDMKGKGLGYLLMTRILDYARTRGIREVFGEVLRENVTMLQMCRDLGFKQTDYPDDPGIVEVHYTFG